MKAGKAHVVPLSGRVVKILMAVGAPRRGPATSVFLNGGGLPISNQAMSELLKGMRRGVTVHGFRSTFMDWCHDRTTYPKHAIDMALAHSIGDKVEAAYRRGDLLAKRVQLMAAWARFCDVGGVADTGSVGDGDVVVPIRRA